MSWHGSNESTVDRECACHVGLHGALADYTHTERRHESVPFVRDMCSISPMSPAAVLELGALIGALAAGVYADRYSRAQSIVAACGELSVMIA